MRILVPLAACAAMLLCTLALLLTILLTEQYHILGRPGPPNEILVGNKVFKVYYSDTKPDDFRMRLRREGSFYFGVTNCANSEEPENYIQINPDQNLIAVQNTLWHEAKHASNDCGSLAVKFLNDPSFDYDGLYDTEVPQELRLMKQNPQLLDFVRSKDAIWPN